MFIAALFATVKTWKQLKYPKCPSIDECYKENAACVYTCVYIHIYTQWNTAAAAKSLQSCLTLCDPIDGSPPGSTIPGILQARTLEWVAISFSNA